MFRRTLVAALVLIGAVAARADELPMQFHAPLDGKHEVPPNETPGTGTLDATLDKSSKVLTYTMTFTGLTGPATAAHFHGPADPGQNAGIAVPIPPPLNSPIKGTATLTDEQIGDLLGNKWYVNIHTAQNPKGEIRGQVLHGGP